MSDDKIETSYVRKKNPLEIIIKVVLTVVSVVVVLLATVKGGEKLVYLKFYRNAERGLPIPGINDKFVGQGLDYLESENVFLACGYSSEKGAASSVYVMRMDGKSQKTELKNADGTNYTGHTGGVAHYKDYCYITGENGLDVFMLSDVLSGGAAEKIGEIAAPEGHDPAFVTIRGGKLYEGSFYRAGNYETPADERITTPSGDENKALIYVYNINDGAEFCVDPTPTAAYSITGLVQGMEIIETQFVLSTSYGLASSHLLFYDTEKLASPERKTVCGNELDVYYLDSSCLVHSVTAPPMSEEIVFKDGKIYIMCESASDKYIFGKFTSGKYMYGYRL